MESNVNGHWVKCEQKNSVWRGREAKAQQWNKPIAYT